MHLGTVHDQFGWHRDGYLGRLAQVNTWTAGGHEFFARRRPVQGWLGCVRVMPWQTAMTGASPSR